MKHTSNVVAVCLALAAALPTMSAQAQNARSFVSPTGSDGNNCTLALPCRTFQAAFNVTNAGGEIAVLGTAGYGGLTINKAISIVNPGAFEAGIIVPSGGTGIVINAGPNDAVNLRGLTIDGGGSGETGIVFASGKSLIIDNCVVRNLQSSGIALAPNTIATIAVSRTIVAENGGHGIYLQPNAGATVSALFNHVEVYHNGLKGIGIFSNGMCCSSFLKAMIVDSISSFNGGAGIYALGGTRPLNLNVARSTTMENGQSGLQAETSVYVTVAQSNLEDGWTAISSNQIPCVFSYGDNYTGGVPPPTLPGCFNVGPPTKM